MFRNTDLEKSMGGDKNRLVNYLKTGKHPIYND